MKLSFTIPCYRSAMTIGGVIAEIREILAKQTEYDYEIIMVNDQSPDDTWNVIKEYASQDSRLIAINLAKNVGKHGALMCAFANATGDYIINIDDDGQCPLDRLWDLIEPLKQGYDMSMAQYPAKKQTGFKNLGSSFNDWMVRVLIGKPKGLVFSNFIARKRFLCDEIIRYKNPYPYLEGLTLRATHNIALVPMEERDRQAGKSGYSLKKSMQLLINGCTAFSVKPLRISGILGGICSVLGVITMLVLLVKQIMGIEVAVEYTSLLSITLVLNGVVMLLLALVGEYIGRMYICMNDSPQFVIREKCQSDQLAETDK